MNRDAIAQLSSSIKENRQSRRFFRHWQNVLGVILVLIFMLIAVGADWLAPNSDPTWVSDLNWENDLYKILPHPPAPETPLGTLPTRRNAIQIDIWTALVHGTRSAMKFGVFAAVVTGFIGMIIGTTSGWFGGWINGITMRISDSLLAIPVIVGVVVVQQVTMILAGNTLWSLINPRGLEDPGVFVTWMGNLLMDMDATLLAIILFSWMPYARLMNSIVLRNKELSYIKAARSLGASSGRIIFKHLIPNSISPMIVLFSKDVGSFVLLQASFTFIGLKSPSEWGMVMVYARDYLVGLGGNLIANWWVFLPITLALVLFSVGWNLLGDGLNDMLNPRQTHSI
jgi:peptide/nickel transport system permease protein